MHPPLRCTICRSNVCFREIAKMTQLMPTNCHATVSPPAINRLLTPVDHTHAHTHTDETNSKYISVSPVRSQNSRKQTIVAGRSEHGLDALTCRCSLKYHRQEEHENIFTRCPKSLYCVFLSFFPCWTSRTQASICWLDHWVVISCFQVLSSDLKRDAIVL